MAIYSHVILLSQFWTSKLFHIKFYYCFLTHIQVSQKTGKVACYPIFWRIFHSLLWPTQRLSAVNEAEINVFLEFPCFFYDPMNVGNLISGSYAFSKASIHLEILGLSTYLFACLFSILWGIHLEKKFLSCVVILCLTYLGIAKLLSKVAALYYSDIKKNEIMPFVAMWRQVEITILSEGN